MKLIDLIAGARPNFMKITSIIDAPKTDKAQGGALCYRLNHTRQQYEFFSINCAPGSLSSIWVSAINQ